jgi:predicted acylesterase/phospholipase RssA
MADASAEAPKDRFCDLVMKGGITSGVVYPPAIFALAGQYRFKNIGGTSAGAIAAAITARPPSSNGVPRGPWMASEVWNNYRML